MGNKEKVNRAGRETNKVKAVNADADDRRFLSLIFPDDAASNRTVRNLFEKLDAEDVFYNVDKSGMARTGRVPASRYRFVFGEFIRARIRGKRNGRDGR